VISRLAAEMLEARELPAPPAAPVPPAAVDCEVAPVWAVVAVPVLLDAVTVAGLFPAVADPLPDPLADPLLAPLPVAVLVAALAATAFAYSAASCATVT
jgi:hypothetical protein